MDYIKTLDARNSRRRDKETLCPYCERLIGVLVLKFKTNDNPKMCRHKNQQGLWCTGSGLTVPLNTVMSRSGVLKAWGIDPHA